ncbi:MAG: GTP cyclohydrolase MptA [Halobacteria archaeon]
MSKKTGTLNLPDIQSNKPDIEVGLKRVGVKNVEKLVMVSRDDERPIVLMATFNVFVDLPAERKGIDMSRNMEVTNEVVEEQVEEPVVAVEDLCAEIAERLLERHDYTTRTEVEMEASYVYKDSTPETEKPTQGTATLYAEGRATEERVLKTVGAEVTGITACPCAQGMMRKESAEKLRELGLNNEQIKEYQEEVPSAAHNQRSRAFLSIQTDTHQHVGVEKIIEVARESMSARMYNLAKREDEHHMTKKMHENTRFVEDVVRVMAGNVVEEFDLPDDSIITIKQENEESIHQHNAFSETVNRFSDLKRQVNGESGTSI